jgi:DNA-binding NarL/FixJ family response regulator
LKKQLLGGRLTDSRDIRVVIADDHAPMLKIVSTLLGQHFSVIAAVSSGDALIQAAVDLRPDVIVSDIDMPGHDGLEVMFRLRALGLEIPFVLMCAENRRIRVARFLAQGAMGYVHKYDIYADLVDAVLFATAGNKFVSRSVVDEAS